MTANSPQPTAHGPQPSPLSPQLSACPQRTAHSQQPTAHSPQPTAHEPQPTNAQPLKGWISTFFVRNKGRRFGPYHVRVWKENGKTHKRYIKPNELETIRASCQAHRQMKKEGREITREFNRQTANLNWCYRMCKRADKGTMRPEDIAFSQRIKREGFDISGRPKLRLRPESREPRAGSPRTFMVPFFNKRLLDHFDAAVNAVIDAKRRNEPEEAKWKRWREERGNPPIPRVPLMPPSNPLPEDFLAAIVEDLNEAR